MLGIHCYYPRSKKNGTVNLGHAEVLTWAASIVSWKKVYGEMRLITTTGGRNIVRGLGLEHLYNGNVSTELDNFNPPIKDRFLQYFWAGCKLWALAGVEESPCCMVDLDAIVWSKFPRLGAACRFLHFDYNEWPCYIKNRKHFAKYLPPEFDRDEVWELPAANTAIMAFYDPAFKKFYLETAINYMLKYTDETKLLKRDRSEMVFSEQRMLSLCSVVAKKKIIPVGVLGRAHLENNPWVTHLWNSKSKYTEYWQSCKQYSEWIIRYLRKHSSEANDICDKAEKIMGNIEKYHSAGIERNHNVCRMVYRNPELKNIKGTVLIFDPNLPVPVKAKDYHLGQVWEKIVLVEGSADVYYKGAYRKTISRKKPMKVVFGSTPAEKRQWKRTFNLIGGV